MMFEHVKFGLALNRGITKYRSGKFEEADWSLDQALEIKREDFIANFFKLRTVISLNQNEKAGQYLQTCIAAKPITEKELLTPFANYLMEESNARALSLDQLNSIADKKMKDYFHPPYKVLDIIKWIAFWFIVFYSAGIISTVINKACATIPYTLLDAALQFIAWLTYYYRRSIVRYDPIVLICDTMQTIKQKRYLFFGTGIGILLKAIYNLDNHMVLIQDISINTISAATPLIVAGTRVLLLEVIGQEVLYQGVLFSFVAQYDRVLAVIVTVMVYVFWETTSMSHIGYFIFFTCIYAKYKSLKLNISLHVFVFICQVSIMAVLINVAR